jgi:hypothetical protein
MELASESPQHYRASSDEHMNFQKNTALADVPGGLFSR